MKATIYAHVDKESNWETGTKLGLTGEALSVFLFACCEVKLDVDVNPETGVATIEYVAGRKLTEVEKQ